MFAAALGLFSVLSRLILYSHGIKQILKVEDNLGYQLHAEAMAQSSGFGVAFKYET